MVEAYRCHTACQMAPSHQRKLEQYAPLPHAAPLNTPRSLHISPPLHMTPDTDLPPLTPVPPGLYRHYKGGWYAVHSTVRCSETLCSMVVYRALYGQAGQWVRPADMFAGLVELNGQTVSRFAWHDPHALVPTDLPSAHALVLFFEDRLQQHGHALWPAPLPPTTCCGRGCNGCVWEGYYTALGNWLTQARGRVPPA